MPFGGALALAWCTRRARGTIDIDVNLLIPAASWTRALSALPEEVRVTKTDRQLLERDGQVRVWWHNTPLDLFLNSTDFHEELAERVRWETFADREAGSAAVGILDKARRLAGLRGFGLMARS